MLWLKVLRVVFIGLKTMVGNSTYITDFKVYDQRVIDLANTNLNLGVKV